MDLDDIQDGEVYAVEESKHDDGTPSGASPVEAGGAIVAHLRVPEGCKGGDAIPIVIDTRQLGDPHGGVKHVGDYPCPDDVQPGEVLPILIKEGDGRGMPPPPPEGFEPEKDVVFVTVPAGCREGDDIPILENGVERLASPRRGCCGSSVTRRKETWLMWWASRSRRRTGSASTSEGRHRSTRSQGRLASMALPSHMSTVALTTSRRCLDFGGKDVADLLAEEAYYQEQAERTASIANATKHQRKSGRRRSRPRGRASRRTRKIKRRRKSASSKRRSAKTLGASSKLN